MCLTYPGLGPTLTHVVDSEKKEKLMGITCLEWEGDDFKDSRSGVWANGLLPSQQDIFGKCSEEKKGSCPIDSFLMKMSVMLGWLLCAPTDRPTNRHRSPFGC